MRRLQSLFIKSAALVTFIVFFPAFSLAADPWDPGKRLYENYMRSTMRNSQNFPIYLVT